MPNKFILFDLNMLYNENDSCIFYRQCSKLLNYWYPLHFSIYYCYKVKPIFEVMKSNFSFGFYSTCTLVFYGIKFPPILYA